MKFIISFSISIFMAVLSSCTSDAGHQSENNELPDPLEAGWNKASVCEVLQDDPNIRILKCTFPPGVGHERHYHAPHFGYTVAGSRFRMTDTTGVREVDVLTGSSFSNERIDWHEVLNIGDSTAVFLIIESKN